MILVWSKIQTQTFVVGLNLEQVYIAMVKLYVNNLVWKIYTKIHQETKDVQVNKWKQSIGPGVGA